MDPYLHAHTVAAIERQRRIGLGWRFDGLGDWTTEALFARLNELGIDTDAQRFAAQAKQAGRCSVLRETWTHGEERGDLWDDFPPMAAEELWNRLTPDLLCPEIVSRYLDEAIRASERGNRTSHLLKAATPLLDYLESFPANERAVRFQEVVDCSMYDYGDALLQTIMNDGGQSPDEAIRLADVLSEANPSNASSYQGDLPFALADAGRREQALERIQANLTRFPDDVWIRVHAGDVHERLGENEIALKYFIEALEAATDPKDWDVFRDRALDVLQKLGRPDRWKGIEAQAPRPAEPSVSRWKYSAPPSPTPTLPAPVAAPTPFQRGPKIGANDPCPCGSGKKYKKCCKR